MTVQAAPDSASDQTVSVRQMISEIVETMLVTRDHLSHRRTLLRSVSVTIQKYLQVDLRGSDSWESARPHSSRLAAPPSACYHIVHRVGNKIVVLP